MLEQTCWHRLESSLGLHGVEFIERSAIFVPLLLDREHPQSLLIPVSILVKYCEAGDRPEDGTRIRSVQVELEVWVVYTLNSFVVLLVVNYGHLGFSIWPLGVD